jgi:hypothetical protein
MEESSRGWKAMYLCRTNHRSLTGGFVSLSLVPSPYHQVLCQVLIFGSASGGGQSKVTAGLRFDTTLLEKVP